MIIRDGVLSSRNRGAFSDVPQLPTDIKELRAIAVTSRGPMPHTVPQSFLQNNRRKSIPSRKDKRLKSTQSAERRKQTADSSYKMVCEAIPTIAVDIVLVVERDFDVVLGGTVQALEGVASFRSNQRKRTMKIQMVPSTTRVFQLLRPFSNNAINGRGDDNFGE